MTSAVLSSTHPRTCSRVTAEAALNVRAAYEVARRHLGEGLRIVTLLCDHGSRYSSRVFNPDFLASKQLEVKPLPTPQGLASP